MLYGSSWRAERDGFELETVLLPVTVGVCPALHAELSVFLTDMVSQALELSNQPHVVVATPGRLADHIRSSSTFSMSKIQFLVSSGRTTDWDQTWFLSRHYLSLLHLQILLCVRGSFKLCCCLCRCVCQIMDEADRLLEQGCTDFTKDLETIMSILPAKRQTLLFSATLTDTLQELKNIAMNKPFFWESQSEWESCASYSLLLVITDGSSK